MSKKNNDINKLVSDLLEKPKAVSDEKMPNLKKIVIPGNLLEDDIEKDEVEHTTINSSVLHGNIITGNNNTINNFFEKSKNDYKRDTSASSLSRDITDYRDVGEKVNIHQMTRNEYISHLGYIYTIENVHKWDGIERLHHRPNWTPDFSHNVTDYEQALDFIGIEKNESAPDGLEKRHFERRQGIKDIRSEKLNRRTITEKGRRKEDKFNYIVYFITVIILLIVIVSWISYSVKELMNG